MTEQITSLSNPLVKQARALRQKQGREETDLFLVEGLLHVGEAVQAGWQIHSLLYAPDLLKSDFGYNLLRHAEQKRIRCAALSAPVFESFAGKENPQGIAALVQRKNLRLEEFPPFQTLVALHAPQDPGNIGAIFRSIDASGADGLLLLDGGADPYQPAAIRASMGAIFWKPFASLSFAEFIPWVKAGGTRLVGTSSHAAQPYSAFVRDARPVVLLLGSEQKGLSAEQLNACDTRLSLPMRGRATSLNLAVAAGIFLYAIQNQ